MCIRAIVHEGKNYWAYKFYIDNKKGVKYQTHTHLEGKELGLAGLITGIIGISLCLLLYISLMILIFLENQVF